MFKKRFNGDECEEKSKIINQKQPQYKSLLEKREHSNEIYGRFKSINKDREDDKENEDKKDSIERKLISFPRSANFNAK